jgi:hypothetical protein
MDNKREKSRSPSYARVFLTEQSIVGHLRDLSAEGCRMSFLAPGPRLERGREIDVVIVPVEDLGIPRIPTNFVPRWVRSDGPSVQTGGILSTIPREFRDAYERLLAYFSNERGQG